MNAFRNHFAQVPPVDVSAFDRGQQRRFAVEDYQQKRTQTNQLNALMPQAVAGDQNAFNQVAAIDPGMAIQIQKMLEGKSEAELRQAKRGTEKIGQELWRISNEPPERQQPAYQAFLETLPPETRAKAPPQWSPDAARTMVSQVLTLDQVVERMLPKPEQRTELDRNLSNPTTAAFLREQERRKGTADTPTVPAGYRQTAAGLEPIPGGPADPANPLNQKKVDGPSRYTPKEISTARSKVLAIDVAQKQLNVLKEKWAALKDTRSAGLGQGWVPSEGGKNFDAAVDQIRSSITGLKRVPGVGAMSDYETRLDQSMLPQRGEYESSIAQKIEGMQTFLDALSTGYGDIVAEEGLPTRPAQGGGLTPEEQQELMDLRKKFGR